MNQARRRDRLARKLEEAKAQNQDGQSSSGSAEVGPTHKEIADDSAKTGNRSKSPADGGEGQSEPGSSSESKGKHWKQNAAATLQCNFEERIKSLWRSKSQKKTREAAPNNNTKPYENDDYVDDEYTDHFYPSQVDLSEVDANIVQVREILSIRTL